ncbi:MAG: hypothetical protein RR185_08075 [Angelakisella sp.]
MRKTQSGKVIEYELYESIRPKGMNLPRGANVRESTTQQKLLNEIRAKRWLTRLVNCNFVQGDSYITLTYSGQHPPKLPQAKKDLDNFLRRLRALRKKLKLVGELKYICVTESDDCRMNHHVVTQHMPEQLIMDLWQFDGRGNANGGRGKRIPGHGRAPCDRLDGSYDYTFLARYVGKDKKSGKRWRQSKGLKKPKVLQEKEIPRSKIRKTFHPPKGYKVVEDNFSTSDIAGDWRYIRIVPELVDGDRNGSG